MRARLLFVTMCLMACASAPLAAQVRWRGITIGAVSPFKDCNLQRESGDDFVTFGVNQVHARRWQLEAISIGLSAAAGWAAHHFIPLPWFQNSSSHSAAVAGAAVSVLPHTIQLAKGVYNDVDLTHYSAEAAQRMAPYALTFTDSGSFSRRATGYVVASGLIILGACDAQR